MANSYVSDQKLIMVSLGLIRFESFDWVHRHKSHKASLCGWADQEGSGPVWPRKAHCITRRDYCSPKLHTAHMLNRQATANG